jgi:hypothetical protein
MADVIFWLWAAAALLAFASLYGFIKVLRKPPPAPDPSKDWLENVKDVRDWEDRR